MRWFSFVDSCRRPGTVVYKLGFLWYFHVEGQGELYTNQVYWQVHSCSAMRLGNGRCQKVLDKFNTVSLENSRLVLEEKKKKKYIKNCRNQSQISYINHKKCHGVLITY